MKTYKTFDVHDKDVTPAIYIYLFSGIETEIDGNDRWYEIDPWEEHCNEESLTELWNKQIERGSGSCYHNKEAMKKFIANPCTWQEALEELKKWLKKRKVKTGGTFFVKIWW